MKRFFIGYLLVIIVGLSPAGSMPSILKGKAPSYSGDKIVVYTYSNMISFKEKELGSFEVNNSGDFICTFDIQETRLVFMNLGTYNCYLFAEPGKTYVIKLPEKREKTPEEAMNPYFTRISIHLVVKTDDNITGGSTAGSNEELNFNIKTFNDAFYPYYYKYVINAAANAPDKKEIDSAIGTIRAAITDSTDTFFRKYAEYRIGLLYLHGGRLNSSQILSGYFTKQPVLYNNPAYMELFNEIFTGYLEAYNTKNPGSNLFSIINREKSYNKLKVIYEKDKSLSKDTLQELVLIKSLYDAFYEPSFVKSSVLILLDSLRSKSTNKYHVSVIDDIKTQMTRLLSGFEPPSFELYDKDSNLVRLSDFLGSYVYLGFCNSVSYHCIKEFELLSDLYSRHKNHLRIITILVDNDFNSMKSLLQNEKYNWNFLHYGRQPGIIDNYDVRSYPTYYLIGPDGTLISSPAPSPLEGFENHLFQVMKARGDI